MKVRAAWVAAIRVLAVLALAVLPLAACRPGSEGSSAGSREPASGVEAGESHPVIESHELTVEGPAGTLAGTLTRPTAGCPCPLAILIPGVGAHDRDYTLWGRSWFRDLAEHLARNGIASLRYDERGVGGSTADPTGATSADYGEDVRAWAAEVAHRTGDVDPDRIGLIGHSEGGTIAGLVAAGSGTTAFVVLLASPGLPGREYNLQYEASMARATGFGEEAVAERRAFQERVLDIVVESPDSARTADRLRALYSEVTPDVPPERLERGIRRLTSPWFRFNLVHDPGSTLHDVDAPVLAVFGGLDRQVPPAGNRDAMARALDVDAGVDRVVVLPGLNHFLQRAETGAPDEYPGIEGTWAPEVLDLVTGWVRTHTGPRRVGSCTVLHVAGDGYVLAGNNEDWEDPATRFWIIPAEGGHHGWIKFGFAGEFPQGGMNDEGLFWDGTGVPYRDMPVSEATRTRYEGPLMEKVIAEAGSVAEARAIFDGYYCEDQYRAQYLVGDADGESLIIEGDTIIAKTGPWQVATNFRLSQPELGGYPCSRYEAAAALLDAAPTVSPGLVGQVLEATHQEGRYPTQYSNIYDLRNRAVYLFYNHDFNEYVVIDLAAELTRGARSYDIAPLFSGLADLTPAHGASLPGTTAELRWRGSAASQYRVCVSTSSDTSGQCEPAAALSGPGGPPGPSGPAGGLLAGSLLLGLLGLVVLPGGRRRPVRTLVFLACAFLAAGSCGGDPTDVEPDPGRDFVHTVSDLEPGTTYYWQIVATAPGDAGFSSRSPVRTFVTGSP